VKKVLVVDDSPIVREHLRKTLELYDVVEAGDGLDGLQKLRSDPSIAMVLCDVNMPRMNGLDLLETWARESATTPRRVPFVLLTSEAQPALLERAKKAGAVGWIVKPFRPSLLQATVRKLLGD
jgi:two-component system chemotaxis response regulator CheY